MKLAVLRRLARPGAWLTSALIGAGALLRVAQYLANRSLFLDEAALAMNVLTRSYGGFFGRLDLMQAAPSGFLILEKLAVEAFGESERALRLVPLLAGLGSLLLFARVAKRCLPGNAAAIAVGLFALCGPLIDYSSQVKQYSTDVLAALILLDAALDARHPGSGGRKLGRLALLGAVSVWFSHPAVLVIAAIGGTLGISALSRRDRTRLAALAGVALLWTASFGACWMLSLRATSQDRAMAALWASGFPSPAHPVVSSVLWAPEALGGLFEFAGGPSFKGLGLAAFLVGAVAIFVLDVEKLALLAAPIGIALFAAALREYPFAGRLTLFLFPFLFLVAADGAERIRLALRTAAPLAGAIWIALLFFHPVRDAARGLLRPPTREELRPVFAEILRRRGPQEGIYVYHGANCAFLYYARRFGFRREDAIVGTPTTADWNAYRRDLERLRGRRAWILFSHVFREAGADEEKLFRYFLDGMGTRLDAVLAPGAAGYLYDLGPRTAGP